MFERWNRIRMKSIFAPIFSVDHKIKFIRNLLSSFEDNLRTDSTFPFSNGKKGEAIPVIGHEVPQGCETSRLPHFLDHWFSTFFCSWTSSEFHSLLWPHPSYCLIIKNNIYNKYVLYQQHFLFIIYIICLEYKKIL
jgi:hypothetical protein